jgi:hypothetical protein
MRSIFDAMLRFSYARDLHSHLKGLDQDCQSYTATSIYEMVLWSVVVVTFLFVLNYYRGFLNRPRFTSRLAWLINLLLACAIIFMTAYFRTRSDLLNGVGCPDLHYTDTDIVLFASTAALYTFILGLILSVGFKFFSVHHRRIPF